MYSIHHLEAEIMCIFNVFKMYSVILFFVKVTLHIVRLRFSSGSSLSLPYDVPV